FIQNLGDGTYFHSGQLAIQASVAAGVNITYKLLYNDTVAMTGGQDPQGQLEVPDVCSTLLTQGVSRVLVTTDDVDGYRGVDLPDGVEVWDRSRLIEAQEVLATVPGVTVLIHDQGCAAEARRARKRGLIPTPPHRIVINHRICEGCGDCGQVSNCLSVQPLQTEFGRKTTIDQTTCNLDYSCLEGDCPSFMTVTRSEPGRLARWFGRGDREAAPTAKRSTPAPPTGLADPVLVVPADDYALRITGIGGTGVVTVAQVLGTAAMLDGFHVRGLDQIGLSQKAGPVVSDVRLSRTAPTATNRLGEGQADLLLAFDQLVAASDRGLLTADPDRTTVVGSMSPTPTGRMITHLDVGLPAHADLAERIGRVTRTDQHHWADAAAITTEVFGSSTTANMFVIGMAVQAGCLPISAASLEQAITLNGVAVEANVAAFRWGRLQVESPDAVAEVVGGGATAPRPATVEIPSEIAARIAGVGGSQALRDRLEFLAAELVRWGSARSPRSWIDTVDQAWRAEQSVSPGSEALTAAVADNLFKLTAYKDEYEVARLMLDPDGIGEAQELAGTRGKVAWKLHPPMLRALGMQRKLTIGTWATPGIRALAAGKRVRGTIADPFRWAEVRRVERKLPGEYRKTLDRALTNLTEANLPVVVELASLPDMVRGYEDIKLGNVERYRAAITDVEARI
ncbi:MAG: DUF6537 domain-containing protein, partial [Actinomycetota bacterium]